MPRSVPPPSKGNQQKSCEVTLCLSFIDLVGINSLKRGERKKMVEGERGFTRPVLIPEVIEVHPAPSAIAPAKARVLFSVATTTPSLNVHSPAAIEPNTQLAMSALGRTSIASGLPTICVPCQQQFVKSIINAFGGSIPVPFQLAPYTLDGVCCCNRFLA